MAVSGILNVIAPAGVSTQAAEQLRAAFPASTGFKWLSPGKVFEFSFSGDREAALGIARRVLHGVSADINVVPVEKRRKKLLIADMDSTIINCECLDEIADMAGLKPKISAITEQAMRGELDFADALRARMILLKGLELPALERVWLERIKLNPGAKTLVATMKKAGAHTRIVSGGFTYYTSRVAKAAGFDADQANELLDDGKALLGTVSEPILGREAKLAALEEQAKRLGLGLDETLAVGDGANDLDMIRASGLGVAYHAKPIVAEAAGAAINQGDLTGLLYLQGYSDDEFVGG